FRVGAGLARPPFCNVPPKIETPASGARLTVAVCIGIAFAPSCDPASMIILLAITLFLSSSLLFLVQPMIAKMVLPLLGGTPAVWNTCMVFFQATLLAGYLYVHAATRWLRPRQQVALHVTLLIISLVTLPIVLVTRGDPPVSGMPVLWLIRVLAV